MRCNIRPEGIKILALNSVEGIKAEGSAVSAVGGEVRLKLGRKSLVAALPRDYRSLTLYLVLQVSMNSSLNQYNYHVMQYAKTAENKWLLTELEGKEQILSLQTIDFKIQFSELYEQVDFSEQEE